MKYNGNAKCRLAGQRRGIMRPIRARTLGISTEKITPNCIDCNFPLSVMPDRSSPNATRSVVSPAT